MISSLVVKELHQHWLAFVLVGLLLVAGFGIVTGTVAINDVGSLFEGLKQFLTFFVVLASLVLGNRLVVREYQSQTQLFLESLPVSRPKMIAVKYLFGLSLLVTAVGLAFIVLIPLSARQEQLSARFLQMVLVRSLGYTWCIYSLVFLMGLFGRYRVALYLFGILAAFVLETQTSLELNRFGPFALVDERFAYERNDWPTEALLVTAGLSTTLVALMFLLSLSREGSVASLLAEKMSHREKIFISVLMLGFLFAVSVYDEQAEKQPFDLPQALVASAGGVRVKVSIGASKDERPGQQLAELVARQTAEVKRFLQLQELPPIFIVQRRDLDADRFERGVLEGAEGLLVRANFRSPQWNQGQFLTWLIRELLIVASEERLEHERNRWLLDGFGLYWVCRDEEVRYVDNSQLELRACYGTQQGFSEVDLRHWLSYRERVGADIAAAVAWSGLMALDRHAGELRCRALLRTVLDCDAPADVRSVVRELRWPLPVVFEEVVGRPYSQFVQQWSAELAAVRRSRSDELARIPRVNGSLAFVAVSAVSRTVSYQFTCEPPPSSDRFVLIHMELPPFDDEVAVQELRREELGYSRDKRGELPGTFGRGGRLYATFAIWDEKLGCEVITGWRRREIE